MPLAFSGTVLAGSTPLDGAEVRLFAAGTAGNGSAPTPLLSATLTTDTNGVFRVAVGTYLCPANESVLYAVSTGGHIGTQAENTAVSFITVLGACSAISPGSTHVINEVTTVATAFALRPFLSAGGQMGSSATNTHGLALGVSELGNLVDLATGAAPGAGFPANGIAPVAKLNTLANALYGCAMAAGPGSQGCSGLFAQTSAGGVAPANTLDAILDIANQPGTNVAGLYALAAQTPAYTPLLSAAPPDWTMAVPFTGGGMQGPSALSIDSTGRVWVANYFGVGSLFANSGAPLLPAGITGSGLNESYGGAVDASDRMWVTNEQTDSSVNNGFGSVTVLNAAQPTSSGNSQVAGGGLNFPISISFDRNGRAWVVDYGNSHISVLDASGAPLSGPDGYASGELQFPVAIAVDSRGTGWVANQSSGTVTQVAPDGSSFTSFVVGNGPSAVAVDAGDAVWVANYYGDSIGLVSPTGQVLSNGGFTGGGLDHPTGIALDGAGTAWVANYRGLGISSLAGTAAPIPGAALSPGTGWGSELLLTEPFGVAVDAAGNVWVTSYGDDRLVEFIGAATPVKTPLLGGVRVP